MNRVIDKTFLKVKNIEINTNKSLEMGQELVVFLKVCINDERYKDNHDGSVDQIWGAEPIVQEIVDNKKVDEV